MRGGLRGRRSGAPAAARWSEEAAHSIEWHALVGLHHSVPADLCVRVSRGRSRVQIHSDRRHNVLAHLGPGRRTVLLWMPDAAPLLGANLTASWMSKSDPRRARTGDATLGLSRAPALVATLRAGDALSIPVGWWHYVEMGSAASGVDRDSIAVSFNLFVATLPPPRSSFSAWLSAWGMWHDWLSTVYNLDTDDEESVAAGLESFIEVPCVAAAPFAPRADERSTII